MFWAVAGDGTQAREAIRGDQDLEMTAPFGCASMTLVGLGVIPDLQLCWAEDFAQTRLDEVGQRVLRHCWVSLT